MENNKSNSSEHTSEVNPDFSDVSSVKVSNQQSQLTNNTIQSLISQLDEQSQNNSNSIPLSKESEEDINEAILNTKQQYEQGSSNEEAQSHDPNDNMLGGLEGKNHSLMSSDDQLQQKLESKEAEEEVKDNQFEEDPAQTHFGGSPTQETEDQLWSDLSILSCSTDCSLQMNKDLRDVIIQKLNRLTSDLMQMMNEFNVNLDHYKDNELQELVRQARHEMHSKEQGLIIRISQAISMANDLELTNLEFQAEKTACTLKMCDVELSCFDHLQRIQMTQMQQRMAVKRQNLILSQAKRYQTSDEQNL